MGGDQRITATASAARACAYAASEEGWEDVIRNFSLQLASGGGAGAIAKTSVAPLERVKVLMQTKQEGRLVYPTAMDALINIPKREGWLAFYKGNGTNVVRIVPDAALKFTANDRFKEMFAPDDGSEIGLGGKVAAGGAAGFVKTIVLYPFDIARTRLTADTAAKNAERQYKGMIDCVIKTARTEGVRGVYKGMFFSLAGIVPYLGLSFTTYDELKKFLPADEESKAAYWYPFAKMSVGATAGVFAQSATYPMDTLRRQMQLNGAKGEAPIYSSNLDCVRKMWVTSGIRSFYEGVMINAIKTAPGSAIQFVAYDYLKLWLTGLEETNTK